MGNSLTKNVPIAYSTKKVLSTRPHHDEHLTESINSDPELGQFNEIISSNKNLRHDSAYELDDFFIYDDIMDTYERVDSTSVFPISASRLSSKKSVGLCSLSIIRIEASAMKILKPAMKMQL